MKKILCVFLVMLTFVLSGCMGLDINKPDITLTTYNTSVSSGTVGEKYIEGLQVFAKDILINSFENTNPSEFEDNLRTIVEEQKHDLIFVNQHYGWNSLEKIASEYPNQDFGITDVYNNAIPSNVTNIVYKYHEGSYLAGFIAGRTIEGNKLGILCEVDDEVSKKLINAFMAGAIKGGGNIEFEVKYIGETYDNNIANSAATELYKNGCEIVFQNLLNPDGALTAAESEDKFIIGVGLDQSLQSSSHVLTSVIVNYDIAFSSVVRKYLDKEEIGGKTFEFGLSDYIVSLSKTNTHISKNVFSETNKIKEKIIKGVLTVPCTPEEVEALRQEAIENPVVKTPPEAEETETEEAEGTEDTKTETAD